MTWAGKVMSHQLLRGEPPSFDLNLVHTCSLDGGSSYEVVSGLVLGVDQQALETVVRSQGSPFKALLVNADLTPEAKHKGFKQTLSATKVVSGCDAIFSGEQSWVSDVMALFEDLKVSVVLVKGKADSALKDLCGARGVAVLEMVPHHALVVLRTACNVDLTTYVLESTPRNVCDGLMLKPLLQDWTDRLVGDKNYLVITFPAAHVQTLVIRHPSPGWRESSNATGSLFYQQNAYDWSMV
nr:hypothetical protein BaRGS_005544 [Batillaria attramentaria]